MFLDRTEAGEHLAAKLVEDLLVKEASRNTLLVLSIPRGGVVVGAAVANALGCAHEVVAVKKIGFPGRTELAIGAVAEGGTLVLNPQIAGWFPPESNYLTQAVDRGLDQEKLVTGRLRVGYV
jgi:putative phosphoribosyl transferase